MLFTFPSRYLFTIGRQLVFSLTRWSAQIHTRLHLYRVTQELPRRALVFGYGPLTLYGALFHTLHLTSQLPLSGSYNPRVQAPGFGLFRFRSPLLTESLSFSVPLVTEMFHFTRSRARRAMYSHGGGRILIQPGYPIRKSTGRSVFAALRGLSQLITSFIACWHQGIHHVLLSLIHI